jgi:hypothetical protein
MIARISQIISFIGKNCWLLSFVTQADDVGGILDISMAIKFHFISWKNTIKQTTLLKI